MLHACKQALSFQKNVLEKFLNFYRSRVHFVRAPKKDKKYILKNKFFEKNVEYFFALARRCAIFNLPQVRPL